MITIERQGGGKGKARRNIQILFGWKPVLMGAEEEAGHQRTDVVDLRWRRPVEVPRRLAGAYKTRSTALYCASRCPICNLTGLL